jgi:transposase-like protein
MSELATLSDLDTAKHGRRYTPAEKEAAYQYWRLAAGRSARKVSARLGIEERTILRWRNDEGWIARGNAEDQDEYASSTHAVTALIVSDLVPNIETARSIRDNESNDPRVRLAALQWLSGLAGVSPVSKIESSVIQAPKQSEVIDVPSLVGMSPDELMRLEQATRDKSRT